MTEVLITTDRLRELLDAEAKLIALENAGVENWEWYDAALALIEEKKIEIVEDDEDTLTIFISDDCIEGVDE